MANGQQENLDLSYNQQSATSSSGRIQANWVGSLVTGTSPPDGSQYVAISNLNTNTWSVQSKSSYTNWYDDNGRLVSTLSSLIPYTPSTLPTSCIFSYTTLSLANVASCLNNLLQNQQLTQINQEGSGLLSSSVEISNLPTTYTQYQNQASFSVPLYNYFITNPVITLRLDGSFVGVVIPEGKPKIISASTQAFNSGNNGTIKVEVENIGNAQGAFYYSLNNCAGISTISSSKYAVDPGQTQEIDIPLFKSGASQTVNEQCVVETTEYNGGGSDSSQVNVVMKQANQCTPNQQIVQGSSLCSCINIDGVYQSGSCKVCAYGITVNNSRYVCAPAPVQSKNSSTVTTSINPTQTVPHNSNSNISPTQVLQTVSDAAQTVSTISCPFIPFDGGSGVITSICAAAKTVGSITSMLQGFFH